MTRINDALETGAIVAFADIQAEEIDNITQELGLNVPPYLPDDASDSEKAAIEDFYAITARADGLDSEDIAIVNFYTFFGTDFISSDTEMTLTVYSGDQELKDFNPDDYEEDSANVIYEYIDENGNLQSQDTTPVKYDYADNAVQNFLDWCDGLDDMKSVNEVEADSASLNKNAHTAADEASPAIFPGVTMSFKPYLYVSPRIFYMSVNGNKVTYANNAWKRDTALNFNIIPVHKFGDGSDFYIIKVTGSTDPSQQYAHLSYMGSLFSKSKLIEGMTRNKPGTLNCDNILGYKYRLQYTARLKSGNQTVGTIDQSMPDTVNKSTKVSKGFTFALDGNVSGGLSAKDGKVEGKADVSIKPSWKWETKEEFSVSDYEIAKIGGSDWIGWKWEFQRPKDGSHGLGAVWLDDVELAGRSSVNLKSAFVVRVTKEEWKQYPNLKLAVEFSSQEGATESGGSFYGIGNSGRRDYSYDWSKKQEDFTLPRPPHIAVTQAKFNYKATDAKGDTQTVMLQSEENWTGIKNASWIHLTTDDNNTHTEEGKDVISGKATGSSQKQIMISVDPVTDGKPRGGKIIFRASDGEKCIV